VWGVALEVVGTTTEVHRLTGVGCMSIAAIVVPLLTGLVVAVSMRVVYVVRAAPLAASIAAGVVLAFVGAAVARLVGVPTATVGIDWLDLVFQVAVAAVGVLVTGMVSMRVRPLRGPLTAPPTGRPPHDLGGAGRRPPSAAPRPTPMVVRSVLEQPPAAAQPVRSPARTRIFVSYRRADSRHAARGLASALRQRFGQDQVFVDVDSVRPGLDFVTEVQTAVRASAVVIVVIGEGWFGARPGAGSRLHEQDDTVRLEIEEALHSRLPILPVLLDGAAMPRPEQLPGSIASLHRINALPVGHETWDRDVETLLEAVARLRG
jgi:hypothetical protein